MMANITFLSFLLFSMCHYIHVAVNTWLNCSFFTLIYIAPVKQKSSEALSVYYEVNFGTVVVGFRTSDQVTSSIPGRSAAG